MKKSLIVAGLSAALIFTGCGATDKDVQKDNIEEKVVVEETANGEVAEESTESAENTEEVESREFWNTTLPEGIEIKMSETEKYEALEKLIIDEYQIPEDMLSKTKYYYNYVDLNGDGNNEIFVVVMGMYTSGTGGDSALIVYPVGEELHVNQRFSLINEPIVISDKVTNGAKEIVVFRAGGGVEAEYVSLTCSDGVYQSVNDGTVVENLEEITGTAIIANDILKDMENGNVLTLE